MNIQELLPEIAETLQRGMKHIDFGKFGVTFTVHEGRIVSIDESFTNVVKRKAPAAKKASQNLSEV